MFHRCPKLRFVDLSQMDMSSVTDMDWMFGLCDSLESVKFDSETKEEIKTMRYMFWCDKNLTNVDLSTFKMDKVNTEYMFEDCIKLNAKK